jgi:hypothetical protein
MKISKKLIKAKIKWTIELDYPLWESDSEPDEDHIKFYLEESHCQENILDYLVSESEKNICKLCFMGKVEYLGLVQDEN